MTVDQIILFSLFGAVFGMLLWGKFRYDLVAFTALMIGVVLGVVPTKDAFSGFGHPATLVVALVLVVSAGLVRSGAVLLITRTLVDSSRNLGAHIAIMGGVAGVLSAFMNNVAALALLMPVDIATARKAKRAAGLTLMPLSFATILGGMVTLIGTPPNIIIAAIREESLGAPFTMFDFALVGGAAAIAGMAFVALIGWRLIPNAGANDAGTDPMETLSGYISELVVPAENPLIGTRFGDLAEVAEAADIGLLGLIRDGKRLRGRAMREIIHEGDAVVLEAAPDALDEFRVAQKLAASDAKRIELLKGAGDTALVEMVVTQDARIVGKTSQSVGLGWRKRSVLMGIARQGRRITSKLAKTTIKPGDVLLLQTPELTRDEVVEWLGGLPLADRGLSVTRDTKTWSAIGLFAAAVVAASLGLIYLPVALGLVVVAFVLSGILPIKEVYNHIEWPVVVLLGSMIPLGAALETSGGTELISGALLTLTNGMPAWVILTVLMVVTMTLSDVLNNTATTIVAAPVGIQMAQTLNVNPDPFLMAVAVAASAAFLTPIGHKNNTLILGPGGYGFGDYWRMGLPLEIIIITVSIPTLLIVWPL